MVGYKNSACADWWIRYFKDLRDSGLYSDENAVQREGMNFCFMDILRKELQRVARLCNLHRVRPFSNMEAAVGLSDFLFFLPEANYAWNGYQKPVAVTRDELSCTINQDKEMHENRILVHYISPLCHYQTHI